MGTQLFTKRKICIEEVTDGYWAHQEDLRSAEIFPLGQFLKWLLHQITLGHFEIEEDDEGKAVGVRVGRSVPKPATSVQAAALEFEQSLLGLNIVGLLADSREKGTDPKSLASEDSLWQNANGNAHNRVELHYAIELSKLLDQLVEASTKLDLFPMFEAPDQLRESIAQATRCHLLKLDRACVALCRAALESALQALINSDSALNQEFENLKRTKKPNGRNWGGLEGLIEIADRHDLLGSLRTEADEIRFRGNDALHNELPPDQAEILLKNTRLLIGLIATNVGF